MDTFMPQQSMSLTPTKRMKALVRRAAAASAGGILAIAGYAVLEHTSTPTVTNIATTAGGNTPIAFTPTRNDVSNEPMGALIVEPTQMSLSNGTDAFRLLTGIGTPTTRPTAVSAVSDANSPWIDDEPASTLMPPASPTSTAFPTPTLKLVPGVKADPADTARLAAVTWQPATRPSTSNSTSNSTTATTTPIITSGTTTAGHVVLSVNRTAEVKTSVPVKRVSIGQPEIADVQPFAANIILVTAKKPGTTQVIVWDDQNHSESIDVNVEIPLDQLKLLIAKVAPDANIDVSVASDQIVLRGQAPNLTTAKQISDLAAAFGKVQNFIEVAGAQTVAVQVQFAEVSRSVTNSLGVNWGFQDGTSIFGSQLGGIGNLGFQAVDGVVSGLSVGDVTSTQAEFFGKGRVGNTPFAYFIKALRENNLLRVLQEPTLTTTSGEAASFLAGGQVAVPVPADNGQVAIEYKEFGVRLKLTPVVLGNGKIRLVMEAESSELDYSNGTKISGAAVPGLRTRRVQNTVELGEGQTISVAGLLDDSVVATRQSVPGLGDIPVLGQLFRSTRYQRRETELVVLITPRLAGAMNPDQVQPMPGAGWRHPNELEQFAFGDQGGNAEADAVKDWRKPASERGLKAGETQQNTARSQEPAAITQNLPATPSQQTSQPLPPPPAFIGEHGFTQAPTSESKPESKPESTATISKD